MVQVSNEIKTEIFQLIKTWLYNKRKQWRLKQLILSRRKDRLSLKNDLSLEESFLVPVIINNRNRYSYMLKLISWLEKNGYKNIYIIDNQSTYEPLLDYYKTTKHKVFYLEKNAGYMALWLTDIFEKFKNNYYVYTDPDLLPNESCPADVVYQLYKILKQFPSIEKCGVALKINDLPDHYKNKQAVIADEKKHWEHKVSENVFDAPVDSTFALYRPLAQGRAEDCPAYRLSGNYDFYHLPWYENTQVLSEEEKYYINHVSKGSTMWTEKN